MSESVMRQYNCKDEELPVICSFALFSFKRDQGVFETYAPRFKKPYDEQFEKLIAALTEMSAPESETQAVKTINEAIHALMNELIGSTNRLSGYIQYAKPRILINDTGFGIKALREGINKKDVEKVLSALHTVKVNIGKHKDVLTEQGLTDALSATFDSAEKAISKGKQDAYAITSKRASIVQDNMAQFNELYKQLKEILRAGKILYKNTDPVRYNEYTFIHLLRGVRQVPLSPVQLAARAKAAEKRLKKAV
jgi:hypothetical protein